MARRVRRRRSTVAAVAGLTCLAALLAACTSGADPRGQQSPSPTPTAAEPTEGPVTLTVEVYGGKETVATYQQVADLFDAEHPEVSVRLTSTPDPVTSAERIREAITSGRDAPDVFLLDRQQLPVMLEADALQPVDQLLEDRDLPFGDGFQRVALTGFAAENTLACMPYEDSPLVLYYNRRLVKPRQVVTEDGTTFESVDRSWTWPFFVAAAEQVAARHRGVKPVYLPPDLNQLSPFILSAGGQVVDDSRNPTTLELSDGGSVDALKTVATVTRDRRLGLTPKQAERKNPVTRFQEGRLAMLIGNRALVPALRKTDGLRFDVAPIPRIDGFQTVSEVNGLCIAKGSEHVEAAADFIAFAVDGEAAALAAESGSVVPVSLDVLHSKAFTQPGLFPRHARVYIDGARRSELQPYSSAWHQVVAAAEAPLAEILYGTVDATPDEDTPELTALVETLDALSEALFNPPGPTPTPSP